MYPGQEPAERGHSTGSRPELLIGRNLRLDELGVRRGLGGIVAAAHVDFDVAEAVLREMVLEQLQRAGGRHVGHEAHVDLGDGAMRQNGLAAGAGVSSDQAFDVDGGLAIRAAPARPASLSSWTQCSTPSCFFIVASLRASGDLLESSSSARE